SWAVLMSTLHRVRRGEGALLAVNLSLIAHQWVSPSRAAAQALVSTLAILVMYAFNDLYDAPSDWNNPKKDHALIAAYIEHRRAAVVGHARRIDDDHLPPLPGARRPRARRRERHPHDRRRLAVARAQRAGPPLPAAVRRTAPLRRHARRAHRVRPARDLPRDR